MCCTVIKVIRAFVTSPIAPCAILCSLSYGKSTLKCNGCSMPFDNLSCPLLHDVLVIENKIQWYNILCFKKIMCIALFSICFFQNKSI